MQSLYCPVKSTDIDGENSMNLTERYQEKLHEKHEVLQPGYDGILLQLEVTNACNHRCCFCPNAASHRKKMMMDYDFAVRIITECASFLRKDKRICFHMNGEPLLYSRLPELVQQAKRLDYDYVFLTTNGALATEGMLKQLLDAGLDSIKFSINAGTRETYQKIHGHDDFDRVIHALSYVYNYRKETGRPIKIFVSCVGIRDNYHELMVLQELVQAYCDEVVFYYPCNYAGQVTDTQAMRCDLSKVPVKSFEIIHEIPCAVLWNSINVTCEGYLALCCSEANNRLIIEDLNEMPVQKAWLGEKMTKIRQKHLNRDVLDTPCYACVFGAAYEPQKIDPKLFALSLRKREQ